MPLSAFSRARPDLIQASSPPSDTSSSKTGSEFLFVAKIQSWVVNHKLDASFGTCIAELPMSGRKLLLAGQLVGRYTGCHEIGNGLGGRAELGQRSCGVLLEAATVVVVGGELVQQRERMLVGQP